MLTQAYAFDGLTREEFFAANALKLDAQIARTNAWLRETYGRSGLLLQAEEAFVALFVETGTMGGRLELPRSVGLINERPGTVETYCRTAPTTDQAIGPLSPGADIARFFLQLGQVKNSRLSNVGSYAFCRDVFEIELIARSFRRTTMLLCSVVAGHFAPACFPDGSVPYVKILESYILDRKIEETLDATGFADPKGRSVRTWKAEVEAALIFLAKLP